jgi:hypothetical protein
VPQPISLSLLFLGFVAAGFSYIVLSLLVFPGYDTRGSLKKLMRTLVFLGYFDFVFGVSRLFSLGFRVTSILFLFYVTVQ